MKALEDAIQHEWIAHLTSTMASTFPDETTAFSPISLRNEVAKTNQQARQCGIDSRKGIMRFVGLRFLIGDGFHENPLIQKGLSSTEFTPEEFIGELSRKLPQSLRDTQ